MCVCLSPCPAHGHPGARYSLRNAEPRFGAGAHGKAARRGGLTGIIVCFRDRTHAPPPHPVPPPRTMYRLALARVRSFRPLRVAEGGYSALGERRETSLPVLTSQAAGKWCAEAKKITRGRESCRRTGAVGWCVRYACDASAIQHQGECGECDEGALLAVKSRSKLAAGASGIFS
ncbi:hypothetical protein BC628DRAFT_684486 [Trametes gibbosa]|nr:hypothetical protein BC628DRAFT_684486 [Trametes gibbosa]